VGLAHVSEADDSESDVFHAPMLGSWAGRSTP
jgi:hypothetical protein